MNCALGISSVWAMDNLDSKYKLYAFTLKIMALHAMVGIYNYGKIYHSIDKKHIYKIGIELL